MSPPVGVVLLNRFAGFSVASTMTVPITTMPTVTAASRRRAGSAFHRSVVRVHAPRRRGPSETHGVASEPSVGSVGSSYDNALAESINGLYKTELIKPRGPWRTLDTVEIATAEWVDWFNHRRLYEYCGDIPPADLETAYYAQTRAQQELELSNH